MLVKINQVKELQTLKLILSLKKYI